MKSGTIGAKCGRTVCKNGEEKRGSVEGCPLRAAACAGCVSPCISCDLCQKRILMVGGITKMEDRYREVVESRGGVFEYHDGYMKNGAKSLEGIIRRADMVLCPVNCNSHTACGVVKTLGKKYKKPVFMLSGSSLSALAQAIEQVEARFAG